MSFYDWLMKQSGRKDQVGDLARAAQKDWVAPIHADFLGWKKHIARHPGTYYSACRDLPDSLILEYLSNGKLPPIKAGRSPTAIFGASRDMR